MIWYRHPSAYVRSYGGLHADNVHQWPVIIFSAERLHLMRLFIWLQMEGKIDGENLVGRKRPQYMEQMVKDA